MARDPHLHLYDLAGAEGAQAAAVPQAAAGKEPLTGTFPAPPWPCISSIHSPAELAWHQARGWPDLRPGAPETPDPQTPPQGTVGLSAGIHPQLPVWTHADWLAELAGSGRLCAVGECGFDFFEDHSPGLVKTQSDQFAFQIGLARRYDLPLVIHLRKGLAELLGFRRDLARVPSVIFHSWPGPVNEARALLSAGVNAYFSLGTPLLWDAKAPLAALAELPLDRLLIETDAPWQPTRDRTFTPAQDWHRVCAQAAGRRGLTPEAFEAQVDQNFSQAFSVG